MERNISVKVSGIHNLTSARYFAARNVDYMGFCITPSHPSYCSSEKISEIISWVEGPEFVLKCDVVTPELLSIAETTGIQNIHLSGSPGEKMPATWQKIFADVALEEIFTMDLPKHVVPVIRHSGGIPEFSHQYADSLKALCQKRDCFLDFTWSDPEKTVDFLQKTGCAGIIVHGSDDIKTGFQDFDRMDEFFDVLEK